MALGPLLRVARNVTDLKRACAFYQEALGFLPLGVGWEDARLAEALGVSKVFCARLRLGEQQLELTECRPAGAPYPLGAQSDDRCFQHIAIVTADIERAATQAMCGGGTVISSHGPQLLPVESGGVWAWKFRDPDGHPLEFLQFQPGSAWSGEGRNLGYDHSAIGVSDLRRSIEFYNALGLELGHRHVNHGAEQDRLDGLVPSEVDVVALMPPDAPPHLELLDYNGRGGREAVEVRANDIAADRLVFGNGPGELALRQDPDGHFLLLDGRKRSLF